MKSKIYRRFSSLLLLLLCYNSSNLMAQVPQMDMQLIDVGHTDADYIWKSPKDFDDLALKIGFEGGYNIADGTGIGSIRSGYSLGMFVEWNIAHGMFLHAGTEFSQKGFDTREFYKEPKENQTGTGETQFDEYLKKSRNVARYVQAPVLFGYHILNDSKMALNLMAGGYVAYGFSGNHKGSSSMNGNPLPDIKVKFFDDSLGERLDAGLNFKAELDFRYVSLSASYELGLTKMLKHSNVKNRTLSIRLGYKFGI